MDDIDRAQQSQAEFNAQALDATRENISKGPGKERCIGCGEEIPEKRRQLVEGCERCVACQEIAEKEEHW